MTRLNPVRVLILGATGKLGFAMLRVFSEKSSFLTYGTVRSAEAAELLPENVRDRLITNVDVGNFDSITSAFATVQPDIVINCVGVIKQLSTGSAPLVAIPINSILPHKLAELCKVGRARLIHVSTDCVFDGRKGDYVETDEVSAQDLYGLSKILGEVDYPNAVTLRTSIIGHELRGSHSLLDWFLSAKGAVKGFRKAIFSGLPTVELARAVRDYVIPFPELHGVYHVSAAPISKYDLLVKVKERYGKDISIEPDDHFILDRSLNSERFKNVTGYEPPAWDDLIATMHKLG